MSLQLPNHDITIEAAWPQLFIDHKGQYWDVPESISLDLLSLVSESGFRYRLGLHKNGGHPLAVNATGAEAPTALLPGLCAKAAFSYEKTMDFWRKRQRREDIIEKTERGLFWRPSYDERLNEPHSAISGIIGNVTDLLTLLLLFFSFSLVLLVYLYKTRFSIFVRSVYYYLKYLFPCSVTLIFMLHSSVCFYS